MGMSEARRRLVLSVAAGMAALVVAWMLPRGVGRPRSSAWDPALHHESLPYRIERGREADRLRTEGIVRWVHPRGALMVQVYSRGKDIGEADIRGAFKDTPNPLGGERWVTYVCAMGEYRDDGDGGLWLRKSYFIHSGCSHGSWVDVLYPDGGVESSTEVEVVDVLPR